MNLAEYKRRLMEDPEGETAAMRAAREADPELQAAYDEVQAFERRLSQALEAPLPESLRARLLEIPETPPRRRRGMTRFAGWAVAASLVLALLLTVVLAPPSAHPPAQILYQAAATPVDFPMSEAPMEIGQMNPEFQQVGLNLTELFGPVRVLKRCPTLNGEGLRMVLESDQGYYTLLYMPKAEADLPPEAQFPDTGLAHFYSAPGGAMAVIGLDDDQAAQAADRFLQAVNPAI